MTTEDMIPMRRPCFAGDTKMLTTGILHANRTKRGRNVVHKLFKGKKKSFIQLNKSFWLLMRDWFCSF